VNFTILTCQYSLWQSSYGISKYLFVQKSSLHHKPQHASPCTAILLYEIRLKRAFLPTSCSKSQSCTRKTIRFWARALDYFTPTKHSERKRLDTMWSPLIYFGLLIDSVLHSMVVFWFIFYTSTRVYIPRIAGQVQREIQHAQLELVPTNQS